ncbi:hypothetical protein ACFW04_004772 [Cataglyphis niger]
MYNRVKTINKYYNTLEYSKNNKKNEALIKISNLFKKLKFEDTDTVAIRFLHTASLIEKHLNLFMIVCQHVDVATSILNYFYYFGTICMFNSSWNFDDRIYISTCAILTIYNIYKEESIQEFLETAIIEDVLECIDSAQKGFITWSTMPSESKMQILSNFANTLECNGKFLLANIILKWIKMSYVAGKTIDCYQNKRFEVIQIRKPQGIIILKEKDEITLFRELTQSLIIGNSVIVICDPDLCVLAAYCDMFKISGIPPGVINLLSGENLENVQCTNFANSTSTEACHGLTVIQCIVTSRQ